MFGVAHIAALGLDEALIHAPRLDRGLWSRMRRRQFYAGFVLALLTALAGWIVAGRFEGHPLLGVLLVALAPTVFLGNLAVLPSAMLGAPASASGATKVGI